MDGCCIYYFIAEEAFLEKIVPVLFMFFKSIELYTLYMKHDPF